MTISSWLTFGRPAPPGRGSVVGRKFLAPPYCSQHAVFASPVSAFFICTDFWFSKLHNNARRLSMLNLTTLSCLASHYANYSPKHRTMKKLANCLFKAGPRFWKTAYINVQDQIDTPTCRPSQLEKNNKPPGSLSRHPSRKRMRVILHIPSMLMLIPAATLYC